MTPVAAPRAEGEESGRREETVRILRAAGPYAVLGLALAFIAWYSLTAISRPGLDYDETSFVNAALGGNYPDQIFVSFSWHGVPVMLHPYLGALKSWLYWPIFKLFGVSAESVRLPNIAIAAATVCLGFVLARELFDAWLAALLAVLLATDPVFQVFAKADFGPVIALSAFLRLSALIAYFGWIRRGSSGYLWLLAVVLGVGTFGKVDFLSFVGALGAAALVVHHREIWVRARARPLHTALPMIALAAFMAVEYALVYVPASHLVLPESHAGFPDRLREVWDLFVNTLDGTGLYGYMTGEPLPHATGIGLVTVLAVVLAIPFAALALRRRGDEGPGSPELLEASRVTAFFLVMFVATSLELVLTPQVTGPHHVMLIWPLSALLAVSVLAAASRLDRARLRTAATAAIALGLVAFAATQVRTASSYRSAFAGDRPLPRVWTTDIYPLADAVNRAAPGVDGVVMADWGIGTQVLGLGNEDVRQRLIDAWSTFCCADQRAADGFAAINMRNRLVIVAFHRSGSQEFPGTTAKARAAIKSIHPRRVEPIYSGRALVAYLVDDRE